MNRYGLLLLLCLQPAWGQYLPPDRQLVINTSPPHAKVWLPHEGRNVPDDWDQVRDYMPVDNVMLSSSYVSARGQDHDFIVWVYVDDAHRAQEVTVTRDVWKRKPAVWPADGSTLTLEPLTWTARLKDVLVPHPLACGVTALGLAVAAGLAFASLRRQRQRLARAEKLEKLRAEDPEDLKAGTVTGVYRLQGKLGSGGMAVVYRAVPDVTLDEDAAVAIKMIKDQDAKADLRDRFAREVRLYQQLNHPNIVRLIDWGDAAQLYIVMELVDGKTMRELYPQGQYSIHELLPVLQQVAAGLQYAHDNGVVHRDLKPDNVMVTTKGRVKVMDFGLARQHAVDRSITKTGTALGTPAYMAPEQIMGNLDVASDQYAFGVMTYELLAGRHPLLAAGEVDSMGLIIRHLTNPPHPLADLRPDLDPAVAAAVMRMLEKDPKDRFPSIRAAVDGLTS